MIRATYLPVFVLCVVLVWDCQAAAQQCSTKFDQVRKYDVKSRDKVSSKSAPSFVIDYESNSFLKDGEPFNYISGSIHYFRVHPLDWRDRIVKMKHAGINTLQTYIEWGSHEPEPGTYDFSGILNITEFLTIAQEEGLLVILRPGPYICAERDMGGLPYWLLRENPTMELRTSDENYLRFVDRWFCVLFQLVEPFLYSNGGPVIMVQIENEYGSYYACDFVYTSHLRDLARRYLGDDVVLFTTDGAGTGFLKCGKVADVYATVDFGPGSNVENAFKPQRLFEPRGPLVNSEYYPGWLDHWGEPHANVASASVARTLDDMLAMNASVNIYVFEGGTNFGLTAGANLGGRYQPDPTSYDYDAPLTEAGDPTQKFYAIRNVTQKYTNLPPGPVPPPSLKYAYGDCLLTPAGNLFDVMEELPSMQNKWPLSFEALSLFNGLVVYQTEIPRMISDPSVLGLFDLHDRGYVFVEGEFFGVASREEETYEIPIYGRKGDTISIVVESQGRIGYGSHINDFKGLLTNATLGTYQLENWIMTPVNLNDGPLMSSTLGYILQKSLGSAPKAINAAAELSFYSGNFEVPSDTSSSHPMDTFLRLDGWSKGYVYINNFLLGRYWPVVGPQVTLYIPHGLLTKGSNSIMLLELEKSPCREGSSDSCKVTLVENPEINGETPGNWERYTSEERVTPSLMSKRIL